MGIKLSKPSWLGGNGGGPERGGLTVAVNTAVVVETEEQVNARKAREEAEREVAEARLLAAQKVVNDNLVGYFAHENDFNAMRKMLAGMLFEQNLDETKKLDGQGAPIVDFARIEGIVARVDAIQRNGGSSGNK